jgi:hypothetical protein
MRSKTLLRTTRAPALSKLGKVSRHYFLDFYFTWFYTIISKIFLAIIHDFCQYFKTFVIFQNLMRIFYNKWIIWKLFQGTVYICCQRCRWNFHLIMHIFFRNKYFLLTTILIFCAAQLWFGLVELEYRFCFSIELAWIWSSLVMVKLYTETQLHSLPGSALKVCVGGWVVGWERI